jgi:hypothetical protein
MGISVEGPAPQSSARRNGPTTAARILVVEDADAIRLPGVAELTARGFAVESGPDGS